MGAYCIWQESSSIAHSESERISLSEQIRTNAIQNFNVIFARNFGKKLKSFSKQCQQMGTYCIWEESSSIAHSESERISLSEQIRTNANQNFNVIFGRDFGKKLKSYSKQCQQMGAYCIWEESSSIAHSESERISLSEQIPRNGNKNLNVIFGRNSMKVHTIIIITTLSNVVKR
jgi:hypothetical protein